MTDVSFEQSIARLEEIVAALDSEGLDLQRALALFEEGVRHLRAASTELARAEAQLQELQESAEGALSVVDVRA